MKHRTQKDVLFHNVSWQTETCPVKANIEVAIAIEIVWTHEDMEVTNTMDHHEEDEQDSRTCQADAVTSKFDVLRCEDRGTHFVENGEPQAPEGMKVCLHVEEEDTWIVVIALMPPVLGTVIMTPGCEVWNEVALVPVSYTHLTLPTKRIV